MRTRSVRGNGALESRILLHGGGFGHGGGLGPGGGFGHGRGMGPGGLGGGEMQAPTVEERVDGIMEASDADGDGLIVADEVSERKWERLSQADADASESVSRDEFLTYITASIEERVGTLVDRVFESDANEDGAITEDEVSECQWQRISAADANEDSAVSTEEFNSYLRARYGLDSGAA